MSAPSRPLQARPRPPPARCSHRSAPRSLPGWLQVDRLPVPMAHSRVPVRRCLEGSPRVGRLPAAGGLRLPWARFRRRVARVPHRHRILAAAPVLLPPAPRSPRRRRGSGSRLRLRGTGGPLGRALRGRRGCRTGPGPCGRRRHRGRRFLPLGQQIPEHRAHGHRGPGAGGVLGDVQPPGVEGLDLVDRLVRLHREQDLAGLHRLARLLQPLHEGALLHGPAEPGHDDLDGHGYSSARPRTASAT